MALSTEPTASIFFLRGVEVPPATRSEPSAPQAAPPPSPAVRKPPRSAGQRALPWLVVAVFAYFGARAGIRFWQERQFQLPAGIVSGNGRLEADEIDLATKFAARIAELYVNEGDVVRAGQAVARMDTRDLEAQRQTAEAQVREARRAVDEAQASVAQQGTLVNLATAELERYRQLRAKDFVSEEDLDQRQQTYDGAVAALAAATARSGEAQHALDAARHVVQLYQVNIADDSLRAPRGGRIQYRIANVGEVLAAGGKVFTMLDATSVYMDIYLPTAQAGQIQIGDEARILLDAYPGRPIPAFVSFLASEAQFTPKAVETKSERDKLMFRVKVRIAPEVLQGHEGAVRTGLPGMSYIRVDSTAAWPAFLQPTRRSPPAL